MKLEIDIPEHHYNNIMALDSVNLGRVPYKGIIMYAINAIKHGKILEQELTKNDSGVDCIDRQATLDTIIKRLGIKNESYLLPAERTIYQQIKDMPSVTPQEPRWIPVNERLPGKDGEYLLWGKICEDEENNYCFIGEYDFCAEEFGYWSDHYDSSTLGFLDSEHIEYHKVLAWMPLPTPYEPQEDNNDIH